MNNSEWNELVQHWMDPKTKVGSFQKSKLLYFVCVECICGLLSLFHLFGLLVALAIA